VATRTGPPADPWHALSVKQPWAALLAAGRKTIEVRSWATRFRGPVLIHAAKVPDPRPEAWAWVTTPELERAARLVGGIVGVADVTGCVVYRTPAAFAADAGKHLNAPDWFTPPRLYGFVFRAARPVPFVPAPGNVRFFVVDGIDPGLLPSRG
jgi:hypothetical protein